MKKTFDTHKSYRVALLITLFFAAAALLYPVRWYQPDANVTVPMEINLSGLFLKRGYVDVYILPDSGKYERIDKVQYTACDSLQKIRIRIPLTEHNSSYILQFSHIPGDSAQYRSVTFSTPEAADETILNPLPERNPAGNIIINNGELDTSPLDKKAKNTFFIVSRKYSPIAAESASHLYHWALFTGIILFAIILIFSRRIHLLSCVYILIASFVFVMLNFFISDLNFRSLLYAKKTSAPVLELGMVIPYDDRITLYWAYENTMKMNITEEDKIHVDVNGSPEVQHFSFPLPEDRQVEKIRLYLGRLPFGNREIHYIRFRRYDKVLDIPSVSLPSFFTLQYHVDTFRIRKNFVDIPINDQNSFLETQNTLTHLLEPVYSYRINHLTGYWLSLVISVLVFFGLFFSKVTEQLKDRETDINL